MLSSTRYHPRFPTATVTKRVAIAVATLASMAGGGSTQAAASTWSTPVHITGEDEPITLSPFIPPQQYVHSQATTTTYVLYNVAYDNISKQLRRYEWAYFTGQILHGALFLLVKPKFVD